MGVIKDFRNFFSFRRIIKKNRVVLLDKFNMRIDNADRMYTVLNIPTNLLEDPYNLRKSDVDALSSTFIKDYVGGLSEYLNSIGLAELYK